MKKFLVLIPLILLVGCSDAQGYEADVSNPQIDEQTIELNERYIDGYEGLISQYKEENEQTDNQFLIDSNNEGIEELENRIQSAESNIELAEHTYLYNEEFKTVGNHGIIINRDDGVLSEKSTPQLFSNSLLDKIIFYDENDLIEQAVIGTLTVPTESEEDTEVVAISVYLTKDTLDSLDLNELRESDESIYEYAEGVYVHGSLEEYMDGTTSNLTDGQHSVFYAHIGNAVD